MLNHIVLQGRLVRDPEYRTTSTGASCVSFCIACDRDFKPKDGGERETDFINCVAWRSTAEFITKYFFKGSQIVVGGRLQMRNFTDKDGNKRVAAEVNVDNAYFGGSKNESQSAYTAPSKEPEGAFAPIDEPDAQLPF